MTLDQVLKKTSTTNEEVDALHHGVFDDWYLTDQQIDKPIGISSGLVHTVLTEILGMNKLSKSCDIRMLTPVDKLKRVDISKTVLIRFQANPKKFHHGLVTHDETWVRTWIKDSK